MIVAVIGAGLAGLMTAAELERRGVSAVVLEATGRMGGVAGSVTDDGFVFEPAGGSFNLPHPALDHFVTEFGLDIAPAAAAHRRWVAQADRLVELPRTPPGVVASPLVSAAAKARLLREPTIASTHRHGESVHAFLTRRFGPEIGRLGAHLAAAGVFAGDPHELSVEAAFPRLVALERESGSVLAGMVDARRSRPAGSPSPKPYVPVGGMIGLASSLAARLDVRFDSQVEAVRRIGARWVVDAPEPLEVDRVVVATGTDAAAAVVPDPLARLLRGRPTAPVAVLGLGSRLGPAPFPDGFGALAHPDSGLVTLGVLFESSVAPDRAPADGFLLKVVAGGALRPEVADWTDDYLVRVVGTELAEMLGRSIDVDWVRVARRRIPQYRSGHLAWMANVDEATRALPGLSLTGWGYRGIGIGHLATDALSVATEVVDD